MFTLNLWDFRGEKILVDFNCPTKDCEECEFYRSESWCAPAIPVNKSVYDEKHRIYMEGFWEANDWCEEHYRIIEETLEKTESYANTLEMILNLCYADGRAPTAEEVAKIDNFWNGENNGE